MKEVKTKIDHGFVAGVVFCLSRAAKKYHCPALAREIFKESGIVVTDMKACNPNERKIILETLANEKILGK